jgi:hypothetical protein
MVIMTDDDTKGSPVPSTHDGKEDVNIVVHEDLHKKHSVPLYNAHIDVSGVDERKLMRKLDLALVPWLSLLYLLSFLDRTSIGNAKVRLYLNIPRHVGLTFGHP